MRSLKDTPDVERRKTSMHDACPTLLLHEHALPRAEYPEVHALETLELLAREERVNCGCNLGREKQCNGIKRRGGVYARVEVTDVELYGEVRELLGFDCCEKGVQPCAGVDGAAFLRDCGAVEGEAELCEVGIVTEV